MSAGELFEPVAWPIKVSGSSDARVIAVVVVVGFIVMIAYETQQQRRGLSTIFDIESH